MPLVVLKPHQIPEMPLNEGVFFSFLILLSLIIACTNTSRPASTPLASTLPSTSPVTTPIESSPGTFPSRPLVEIKLTAKDFSFEPTEIHVHKGDHVLIHAKSIEGHHGLSIKGYDLNVDLPEGEEQTVEFNADKTGAFTFFCSVPCGSGHRAMKGQLIVE